MNFWPSPPILGWLAEVFGERFGLPLSFSANENFLSLSCARYQAKIIFPIDVHAFNSTSSNLACSWWSPETEGFSSLFGLPLPMPTSLDQNRGRLFEISEEGGFFNFDLPGFVYWMLSRKEELDSFSYQKDVHGRFPASASHAFKNNYLNRPVIDEWLLILGEAMRRVWPDFVLRMPEFKMSVSHDVDTPSLYGFCGPLMLIRRMAGEFKKNKRISSLLWAPLINFKTKESLYSGDPYNNFDWIMRCSEERGIFSAFYFICGRTEKYKDADYNVCDPAIRRLLKDINLRGHEVGLHPSYNTFMDSDSFLKELNALLVVCSEEGISQDFWGGRMHYLRWSQPETLRIWERAGMTYDATLGYAEFPGFRCGTSYEYTAFDPQRNEKLSLRVRPLIAMEASVLSRSYLGLTGEDALRLFKDLKYKCKAVGGRFELLWHNSSLITAEERNLYMAVLDC